MQSYALATDQIGLKVLLKDDRVFKCHTNRWDTIYYSEIGASAAILDAGFNLDCLMVRYQGIDWRLHANQECNGFRNPVGDAANDGLTIHPLEAVFVKYKQTLHIGETLSLQTAKKMSTWLGESDPSPSLI